MNNRVSIVSAIALLVLFCLSQSSRYSIAASIGDVDRDAGRIIQQQQELQERLQEDVRSRKRPTPEMPDLQPPAMDESIDSSLCFPIDTVAFEGVTLFPLAELEQRAKPYVGRCLSLPELNAILRDITELYFDAGYITSRPYIAPQDLSDRLLLLTVIEGKIEGIAYANPAQNEDGSIGAAFPTSEGRYLNLRDLEQGLEQLNRLQSNSARLNLLPGIEPGSTTVELDNEQSDRANLSLAIDNNGSAATGEIQGHAALGYDNLFGFADYFGLTFSHDFHRNTGKDSRNFFARYEIPFGWHLFGISYNHFNYKQTVEGVSQTFPATGTTRNASLFADRVLYRDKVRKVGVGLALDWKDERNYLLDVLLETSSQHFVVGRASISYEHFFDGASLQINLGYHRGLEILDAQDDTTAPAGTPKAQFDSWSADFSIQTSVAGVPGLSYRGRVYGQNSADDLFPSEQVSIGSLYSVRGFKQDGYSGSSGGYVRNEFAYSIPIGRVLQKTGLTRLEPYVGADWGSVKVPTGDRDGYENLQSWSVGMKAFSPVASLGLSFSQPLDKPESFVNTDGEFAFSLTFYM